MMPAEQLDSVARRERLRVIRTWCLGLGLTACFIALASFGHAIINAPGAWAPTGGSKFSAVMVLTAGGWRPLALPLLACGGGLLLIAWLLTFMIRRRG
jgi:hypothetical protein